MNKILIIYTNDSPFFYKWDCNIFDSLEDTADWILNELTAITDFDLIETVLDLETYIQLYHENLPDICRRQG